MTSVTEQARAKVNLTLRVVGRRADGYHDLESLVAFADCADRIVFTPGATLDLVVQGPGAEACGALADNLVLRAAKLFADQLGALVTGRFTLDKHLPVAAGIGGGSADAAAALR
ncbi:MAG: 4-(cytidine 5'-diphospho)-2-C-methyl-D-erythritol kinase, partial [Xanthobacteraceae bacterium]